MTTPAILPSRNPDHGFFGTLTTCPERDRRSVDVWVLAATLIAKATRATTEEDMIGIRDFLDSRMGRHFADDVVGNMVGCKIDSETAIKSAIPTESSKVTRGASNNDKLHVSFRDPRIARRPTSWHLLRRSVAC